LTAKNWRYIPVGDWLAKALHKSRSARTRWKNGRFISRDSLSRAERRNKTSYSAARDEKGAKVSRLSRVVGRRGLRRKITAARRALCQSASACGTLAAQGVYSAGVLYLLFIGGGVDRRAGAWARAPDLSLPFCRRTCSECIQPGDAARHQQSTSVCTFCVTMSQEAKAFCAFARQHTHIFDTCRDY
jgi:hypothetical protein